MLDIIGQCEGPKGQKRNSSVSQCRLLGAKRTSIPGDRMSAFSQERTFIRALDIQNQAIGRLRRQDHYNGGAI
jgi:hypothetical protein